MSFRNKVPLFPQSACRWQSLLHSSLPMLWWLLPEGCIDFCWHWKDAQKIKIIKSTDNSLCRNRMLLLNSVLASCIKKEVFPMENAMWGLPFDGGVTASETEEVLVPHMPNLRDGYIIPKEAGGAGKLRGSLSRILVPSLWASTLFSSSNRKVPPPRREDKWKSLAPFEIPDPQETLISSSTVIN